MIADKKREADPAVLVVISYYNARPLPELLQLLETMQAFSAGMPYQVRIVVNQQRPASLCLPSFPFPIGIHYRENAGYNIGAWDAAWRLDPPYDAYLFLQEGCRVINNDWLRAFVGKVQQSGVGLVGESLPADWDLPWKALLERNKTELFPEHYVGKELVDRVPCYLDFMRRYGIPPGPKGDHLQSVVLFASRGVLEAIDGFPLGCNYGEAIASEIAISKKVQALGLAIAQVGPVPFCFIEHPQWLHRRLRDIANADEEAC